MNSSTGVIRVCSRAIWIDVALRVTERSEPSFEKDTTQRAARTAASSSELRANVHACFWMMRFCKRFAVTCRAKTELRNFFAAFGPAKCHGAVCVSTSRSWPRVAPAWRAKLQPRPDRPDGAPTQECPVLQRANFWRATPELVSSM